MAIADQNRVAHPLDPLTAEEITAAVAIVREQNRLSERARFATVALAEPLKDQVLTLGPEDEAPPRHVELVILDKAKQETYEVIVSLANRSVVSWATAAPGSQPPVLPEEWDLAESIAKADPGFIEACRKRGVEDLEFVFLDPVSAGNFNVPEEDGRRLVRAVSYWRENARDNGYAYPIGVVPVVDLYEERVISILEGPEVPLPPRHGRFDAESQETVRDDLRDLQIIQPDGVSFEVNGSEIRWQKWALRASMHPREGLVLHTVSYNGRPVLYRAALAEMVVPYGDPTDEHYFKAVFDAGEYGLGQMANSLELGCDCLGEIRYLDATFCDQNGEPMTIKNAICLHEEDFGILWKHFDARSDETEVRRNRRFVISYICTVGNYDYGFYWYLYQDGTIELETKATGIMQTETVPEGEWPEWGELVAPRLGAMHHQHFFNFRLDMTVDGPRNSVYEINSEYLPIGPENPHGIAMQPEATLLATESQAARDVNPQTNRYWKIVNPEVANDLGAPTAYKLIPGHNSTLLAHPKSPMAQRAGFAQHHLWVTRYAVGERYAAGDYPNQSDPQAAPHGVPRYQLANRSLEGEDVVLWYTFGATHFPRPEDWPVMPVDRMGFHLKPHGFHTISPALDVPRPGNGHCAHHSPESHSEGHRQGGAETPAP